MQRVSRRPPSPPSGEIQMAQTGMARPPYGVERLVGRRLYKRVREGRVVKVLATPERMQKDEEKRKEKDGVLQASLYEVLE